ncbi:MAG TPA: metallophosphoesterase, partial [Candidatus Angelobacter sp.]|nr:metallophosphoesterase [Candidatus Angelobacter sp.]
MKAVIVSDSHGLEAILTTIYERHKEEADLFIHCGDSELHMEHPRLSGYKTVMGNVDVPNSGFPVQRVEEVGGLKWLVTHGHLDGVYHSLMNLNYKAESLGANVICFGHTHSAGTESHDGKVFINPGSLNSPRGRQEKTYAVCEWSGEDSPFS